MCKIIATLFYNSFGPSLSSISNTHILCKFHQLFLRCHDNELAIGVIDTVITELCLVPIANKLFWSLKVLEYFQCTLS